MKRVFLDTNILLDYYLNRQGADAAESDAIITNNKKDFLEFSQLPLYTAEEYLNQLMR